MPTFDLGNERVLLATMIKDYRQRRALALRLKASNFGDPKNQVVFRALKAMADRRLEWSEDTLADLAGRDDFGGYSYVRKLVEEYEPTLNVDYHVERQLAEAAKFKVMGDHLPRIAEACQDPAAAPDSIVRMLRAATSVMEANGRDFSLRGTDLATEFFDEMRVRASGLQVSEPSGWPVLDRFVSGLEPGLSIVAGRPSHGKSTWLVSLIRQRLKLERSTYVCGWEMTRRDYVDRLVATETGFTLRDLKDRAANFDDAEKRRIIEATELFSKSDLLAIEKNPFSELPKPEKHWELNERNLDYFESVIRRAADEYPVIAVDVINKLLPDKRPDRVAEALIRIRELALTCGVHVMLLHHMNREAAEGPPTLEGIKGAGAFEEEADLILAIDRPILRKSESARKKTEDDYLMVHVLKQRNGPAPLCVRYRFDGARFRLSAEEAHHVTMLSLAKDSPVED